MLYMMEWSIKDGCAEKAVNKFLSTGAPLPEGAILLGRYHAPGSGNGWLIVETDQVTTVYEHASEWGELLSWKVTPVITDDEAGLTSAKVWTTKEN